MAQRIEVDRPVLQSLLALAAVIEAHDAHSGGHVWRTSRYAGALALAAGLGEGDAFLAQLGGLVHDVGKVGIPDAILHKEGKVTEEERRVIRLHPEIGRDIIANHPLSRLVDRPIAEHHLRADGEGYPRRLRGVEPWIISRVVSICDAFDAMTSFHPHRRDDSVDRALAVLEEERGRQFDAVLAEAFVDLVRLGAVDHVLEHAAAGSPTSSCAECGPMFTPPTGVAEGQDVRCDAAGDEFVLAFAPDAFQLEWTGQSARSPEP